MTEENQTPSDIKPKRKRKLKTGVDTASAPVETEAEAEAVPATDAAVAEAVLSDPAESESKPKRKRKAKAPEPETPAPVAEEPVAESSEAIPAESASIETTDGDGEPVPELDPVELQRTVEALMFAAEEPIAPREIARASGSDSATIRKVLKAIKEDYDSQRRPWDLTEVAGGFRLVTRPEYYPAVQRLKTQTAQRKLTQAALETLALIAYRQPIGRAEIESVRGVGAGPVLRQLLEKKLVQIAGRGTGLGQPLQYGTTPYFLEHFGLKTTQDLPKPGEFKNT
jgi:segregation and condensation protein B